MNRNLDNMISPYSKMKYIFESQNTEKEDAYYFLKNSDCKCPYTNDSSHFHDKIETQSIRGDFPILKKSINGKPLVWLDNAATTQKPLCVIDSLARFYKEHNSNVHRGAHTLAKRATEEYESARKKIQGFIGASYPEEIIFVRGTTEAINLVAQAYGAANISKGDEILVSQMEHHSNIVPWQMLCNQKGSIIKPIPINDRGEIILHEYEKLFSSWTRMVAIAHVSNVLGTINPVREMIKIAHKHGACVLVDGAQATPHIGVNVKELDADFYALSGHKTYGPAGIGVLYGKKALLEEMPPWQGGGSMIKNVDFDHTTYNSLPYKFEAGTGSIGDAVGLGSAIDYLQKIGMNKIELHEQELTRFAMNELSKIPKCHIIGTAHNKTSVLSFIIDGVEPESLASKLDREGIAVRSGHHCAQPVLRRFGIESSVRASIGIYNTRQDIEALVNGIMKNIHAVR
ncbi:MAG: cysteine desulfurase [Bacillota bacterium]|nr:cysteine desulfurase [Bacillota bacterium]